MSVDRLKPDALRDLKLVPPMALFVFLGIGGFILLRIGPGMQLNLWVLSVGSVALVINAGISLMVGRSSMRGRARTMGSINALLSVVLIAALWMSIRPGDR